jgi:hypothetical protein
MTKPDPKEENKWETVSGDELHLTQKLKVNEGNLYHRSDYEYKYELGCTGGDEVPGLISTSMCFVPSVVPIKELVTEKQIKTFETKHTWFSAGDKLPDNGRQVLFLLEDSDMPLSGTFYSGDKNNNSKVKFWSYVCELDIWRATYFYEKNK